MIKVLLFVSLLFLAGCNTAPKETQLAAPGSTKGISLQDVQGDWTCVYIHCEKICETCCTDLFYPTVRIAGDSMYTFEYPFQFYSKATFSLEPKNKNQEFSFTSLRNDTLVLNGTDHYIRTHFEENLVNRLKKDSINPLLVQGEWALVTRYLGDYGDEDIDINFPFRLPKSLIITAKDIESGMVQAHDLQLKVNGSKKKFRIRRLTDRLLFLQTGHWFKEPFSFYYIRKTKDLENPVAIYQPYNSSLFP